MLIELLIGINIILIIAYYLNGRVLLHPAVIICAMFALADLAAIVGNLTWHYQLHFITCAVIWSTLFAFVLLASFASTIASKIGEDHDALNIRVPSGWFIIFLFIVGLVLTALNVRHFQSVAGSSGWNGFLQFGSDLKTVRDATSLGRVQNSGITGLATYYTRAVAFVGIYLFFYLTVVCKKRYSQYLYLWLPCVPYLVNIIISSGRTALTGFVVYLINIYGILIMSTREVSSDAKRNFIKNLLIIVAIFFALFFVVGMLRQGDLGKGNFMLNLLNGFTLYVGFSIPSLDTFLTQGWTKPDVFGANTLVEWYSFLNMLGLNVPNNLSGALAPISINGTLGNLFTGLRRYLQDYSYTGMFLLMGVQGFISSFSFNYIHKKINHPILFILYSIWIYPVFEMMEEERFLMGLGITPIYTFVSIVIMYYIMAKWNFKFNKIHTLKNVFDYELYDQNSEYYY